MEKSHRQKEIISELDEQLELLEKKRSYNGRSVEYYMAIGGEIAILKLIIKLLANYMWRND